MKSTYLSIAGFVIEIKRNKNISLIVENGYNAFLLPGKIHNADIEITAHNGLMEKHLLESQLLFTAIMGGKPLWEISQTNDSYKFTIYSQEKIGSVQQIALANREFSRWEIFMEPQMDTNGQEGVCPLLYPMGPLVLYYLALNKDAIMVHASGIWDGTKGMLFSGFSGTGKSTMAKLWEQRGALIINDDRLVIRKNDEGYFINNTPMFYADKPKIARLDSIYLPFHAEKNSIQKLSGTQALAGIMPFCIQHGYDRSFLEKHLDFLLDLCREIPVYSLGFVPDTNIIDFINCHEG